MSITLANKLQPMWTKKAVAEMTGRDPLGLSSLGDNIKEFLLSGINVNNYRARYYSFYCWALWHIEHEEEPERYKAFVDAFRRREAVMALATLANNAKTSPIGVVAVRPRLEKGIKEGIVDCDFKVLPSKSLGGYEQNYAGSLYHLKLYHRPEGSFDMVTEGVAENLAQAFHQTIEHTPYIKKRLYKDTTVSKNDLIKSAQFLTLDALEEAFCRDERSKLIDIFFVFNEEVIDENSMLRRHSLTLFLHAIAEYASRGISVDATKGYVLDQYLLYAFYYEVLQLEGSKLASYNVPKELTFCHNLWKQFCLHQFFTVALESLLYSILETVSTEETGLLLDELVDGLIQEDFFDALEEMTGDSCHRPYDLLNALGVQKLPDQATSQRLQKKLLPTHRFSEARLRNFELNSVQGEAARGLLLLAVLYVKWKGIERDPALNYVGRRAEGGLWIGRIIPGIDSWFDPKITWKHVLPGLIEEFILNQHDRVMYDKGKLESCWLQRSSGRIIKEQDYKPRWRSSRHYNAVSIMHDLGLLKFDGENEVTITLQGRRILDKAVRLSNGSTEEYKQD